MLCRFSRALRTPQPYVVLDELLSQLLQKQNPPALLPAELCLMTITYKGI